MVPELDRFIKVLLLKYLQVATKVAVGQVHSEQGTKSDLIMSDDPGCTEDLGSCLSLLLSVRNRNLELSTFFVISWFSFHSKSHLCLKSSFLLKY